MPYIKYDDRKRLERGQLGPKVPGELNYLITKECANYADDHGHSYTVYNEIIGVLECAKLEFYRRLAAPYEDTKIKENGDVY